MATQLTPARYVTIEVASVVTGLTECAIRSKIADCTWVLNRQYRKAPDNRIYIDLRGFEHWVEKGV